MNGVNTEVESGSGDSDSELEVMSNYKGDGNFSLLGLGLRVQSITQMTS